MHPVQDMIFDDDLDGWIMTLRHRLMRGEFHDFQTFALHPGDPALPCEFLVRIMLADLDDLRQSSPRALQPSTTLTSAAALREDFLQLRMLLS